MQHTIYMYNVTHLSTLFSDTFGVSEFIRDSDTLLATPGGVEWPPSFDHVTAASDDDLGFDPFFESNKGLADMLERETGHMVSPLTGYNGSGLVMPPMHPHRLPPGVHAPLPHGMVVAGGDMLSAGIMSSIVTPSSPLLHSSIVTSNAPSTLPPMPPPPPGLPVFPQFHSNDVPASSSTPPLSMPNGPGTARITLYFTIISHRNSFVSMLYT